jgi:metal-responsive CopG/Arc/MetJ family transcriptional regulator
MKTAVSIPDKLFAEAEIAATELGLSRSKLIQTALEGFLKARRDAALTEAINMNLRDHPPTEEELKEDAIWEAHAMANLRAVEWDE